MWDIQLFKLNFDQQEKIAVQDVIESEWLTMGEKTIAFNKNLRNIFLIMSHVQQSQAAQLHCIYLC